MSLVLHIFVVVGGSVEIQDPEISAKVLSFTWSTNISNIQNFAIVVINRKTGVVIDEFVKRNERNYSLPMEFGNPYFITLTAFDSCGQHFPSEKVLIIDEDGIVDKLKPAEAVLNEVCAQTCPTSTPTIACGAENQENRAGN